MSADAPKGWMERHWHLLTGFIAGIGVLCVLIACIANPLLVERFISSDGRLEPVTRTRIWIFAAAWFLTGVFFVLFARHWRAYSVRRRRMMIGAGVAIATILVGMLAMEGGLRFVHVYVRPMSKRRHFFFEYDEVLGWKHRPNTVCMFKGSRVTINAVGFRGPDITQARLPDRFRMLFLGDSQLFGDGVADEQTFPRLLGSRFAATESINAGVIGYGTDQQYIQATRDALRFQPDLTVLTINAYDLRDNLSKRVRSGYQKPLYRLDGDDLRLSNVPVPRRDVAERMYRWLANRSQLFDVLANVVAQRSSSLPDDDVDHAPPSVEEVFPPPDQFETALEVTRRILTQLKDECLRNRSRFAIASLPYAMDFGTDEQYREQSEKFFDAIRKWGEAHDIAVFEMREGLAKIGGTACFLDTMHLSPPGHQCVADQLATAIRAHQYLPAWHPDIAQRSTAAAPNANR